MSDGAESDEETDAAVRAAREDPYVVRLLLDDVAEVNARGLLASIARELPGAGAVLLDADDEAPGRIVVAFTELIGDGAEEGAVHPLAVVEAAEALGPTRADGLLLAALDQTWDWEEARDVVAGCGLSLDVYDGNAGALGAEERLSLVLAVVRGVLSQVEARALHWVPSQRVVDPHALLHGLDAGERLASGPANVRVFHVEDGKKGETVMDTMGMAALGLPDAQVHFIRAGGRPDPNRMAAMLFATVDYLLEKGDVIADEDTVQGIDGAERWGCRHEESLVEPRRVVLDVEPGRYKP